MSKEIPPRQNLGGAFLFLEALHKVSAPWSI
jgi:hypothetical protein